MSVDGHDGDVVTAAANTVVDGPDGDGAAGNGPARSREWLRFLATVPIIVGLAFALWYPLPDSVIRRKAPSWWVPATELFGLQQNWAMFSPDPPDLTLDVQAVVTDASGKQFLVTVPRPSPLVGSVYSERYRKWEERIYPVGSSGRWVDAAKWFAGKVRSDNVKPAVVELRRAWTLTDLPGREPDGEPKYFVFFTYDVETGNGTFHDPELNPANAGGPPAADATAPSTTTTVVPPSGPQTGTEQTPMSTAVTEG